MHDLKDPRKVIGRTHRFILAPEAIHGRVGYVSNVVFTCGAIPAADGTAKLYVNGRHVFFAQTCWNKALTRAKARNRRVWVCEYVGM